MRVFIYLVFLVVFSNICQLGFAQNGTEPNKAGLYPLKAKVKAADGKNIAEILIYPQTIEFYNDQEELVVLAGYYPYQGRIWIFITLPNQQEPVIVASSRHEVVYDAAEQSIGFYGSLGGNSTLFNANFEKIGSVFCILKNNLCAAAAVAYLNGVFP